MVLVFGGPTDVNRQLGEQEDEEMVAKSSLCLMEAVDSPSFPAKKSRIFF